MNDSSSNQEHPQRSSPLPDALHRLRAVVLLCGGVRPSFSTQLLQRSPLDLPISSHRTVLAHWITQVGQLQKHLQHDLALRVYVSSCETTPVRLPSQVNLRLAMERQSQPYRGSGGTVADIAREHNGDDYLLIGSGAEIPLRSLPLLAQELALCRADLAIATRSDQSPSFLLLIRCGLARDIPAHGFIDFKEQALPRLAEKHRVAILGRGDATTVTIRNLSSYLRALRQLHQAANPAWDWRPPTRHAAEAAPRSTAPASMERDQEPATDPASRPGRAPLNIIEPTAQVDSGARLQDSVILGKARVDAGAIVAGSVLGPEAHVTTGQVVVGQIITGAINPSRSAARAPAAVPAAGPARWASAAWRAWMSALRAKGYTSPHPAQGDMP